VASVAIDAVIFDIGGVLECTPPTGWQEDWLSRLGLPAHDLAARLAPAFAAGSVGAKTLTEIEQEIAVALALDGATLMKFMDDLWREYLGHLNTALARYFAGLRPRYRTGILSNSFVGAREREQELYGLEDMCDVIVYSHEEGVLKPDPAAYHVVCERLAVESTRCVFVDDTDANVEGARAVGMPAIKFTETGQALRDLEALLTWAPRAQ
jgi:epoxide hydrolase-like predicted phosphatase